MLRVFQGRFASMSTVASAHFNKVVSSLFPPLTFDKHKGQDGRIAVVGGCHEYTGAPYYAAISCLKLGADLVHVFCSKEASGVIKSFSPELIVHASLDVPAYDVEEVLRKTHSIVLGPGLGRNEAVVFGAKKIMNIAKRLDKPIVIDADGLYIVEKEPSIINGFKHCILTPNIVEFSRLSKAVNMDNCDNSSIDAAILNAKLLSQRLGHVTVVLKGQKDIITDGNDVLLCEEEGGPRRCGGQGDLLSGFAGVFAFWATRLSNQTSTIYQNVNPLLFASLAACSLTKNCNKKAFEKHGRSMTTPDMISEIGNCVKKWDV